MSRCIAAESHYLGYRQDPLTMRGPERTPARKNPQAVGT